MIVIECLAVRNIVIEVRPTVHNKGPSDTEVTPRLGSMRFKDQTFCCPDPKL